MNVDIREGLIYVNDEISPFFIQGMNLFLDPFRLEEDPRKIYTPQIVSEDLVKKIIPHLQTLGINTVRIWPTTINKKNGRIHKSSIPGELFHLFEDVGIKIILNLPINWNLLPTFSEIKNYLLKYSEEKYPNIISYCINNEAYYGFLSPHRYLDSIQSLVKKYSNRPTLITNANLNFPKYYKADIIAADFFMYKYSISRDNEDDVGAVFQMFLEDAKNVYKIFPEWILKSYPYLIEILKQKAKKKNIDFPQFQKNILNVMKQTKKNKKPFIVAEYGYTEHPDYLETIFAHMPILSMEGHIWYNWINFDEKMEGKISNLPLFEKFGECCARMEKIKKIQYSYLF